MNKIFIIGHLGQDPQIKHFDNGGKIANFSIATTERWKDKNTGEQRTHTEWHNVAASGKYADIAQQYFRKGSKLFIGGKLRTRSWEQNADKRYITEILMNEFEFLDSKPSNQTNTPQSNYSNANQTNHAGDQFLENEFDDEDDDLGF